MNLRFSRTPRLFALFFTLFLLVPIFAPMNFVILQPGNGTGLFPKVLTVKNSDFQIYKPHGQMYLLAVWVSTPDTKVLGAEVLGCWVRADCVVFPRSVIYKRTSTSSGESTQSRKEMKDSQSDALTATKNLMSKRYPTINTAGVRDSLITVDLPNTGGPSGGLIFSLGLLELLTPEDLLQGRKIAGSGTISPDGSVGAIGGLAEKLISAKKTGATILFAARSNCDNLPKNVSGITVIAISNLEEALTYLQKPVSPDAQGADSAGIYGCTNLRA